MDTSEELFVSDTHGASGRSAILEDDGNTGWLYLTERGSMQPVADVWVYNRIAGVQPEDVERYRDGPPPAPVTVVDGQELCAAPAQHRWDLEWDEGGEAVTLLRDGEPMASLSSSDRRGMSRHLRVECAWGAPMSRS